MASAPGPAAPPAKPPLLQRFVQWARSVFGATLILFVLGLIAMAFYAARSGGVVIARLEIPHRYVPTAGDRAYIPTAGDRADLPVQVLNRLTRLRLETQSFDKDHAAAEVPAAEWLEDYRVQIPETGIAIADLYEFLRHTFGHDIYVRGDVYQRTEKVDGKDQVKTFVTVWDEDGGPVTREIGPTEDAVTAIAEAFYEKAYPYLAIVYADQSGTLPLPEVMSRFRKLAFKGSTSHERALAMNALAAHLIESLGRCEDSIPLLERAAALDPSLPAVSSNLSNAYHCLGRDQLAADATRHEAWMLGHMSRELAGRRRQELLLDNEATSAGDYGDYRLRLRLYRRMEEEGFGEQSLEQSMAAADNHDVRAAVQLASGATASAPRMKWVRFKQLWALHQWQEAASQLAEVNREYVSWGRYVERQVETQNRPLEAMALAAAGDSAKARVLLRGMALDCYLCARARGAVAEAAGKRALADAWFRHAIRLAPELPWAYQEWGEIRFHRSDLAGAAGCFASARRFGPEWADPRKGAGDVFLARGKFAAAEREYRAAAERAPGWGALHLDWGKALWHSGERREALAQFRQAAAIGLSIADLGRAKRLYRHAKLVGP